MTAPEPGPSDPAARAFFAWLIALLVAPVLGGAISFGVSYAVASAWPGAGDYAVLMGIGAIAVASAITWFAAGLLATPEKMRTAATIASGVTVIAVPCAAVFVIVSTSWS